MKRVISFRRLKKNCVHASMPWYKYVKGSKHWQCKHEDVADYDEYGKPRFIGCTAKTCPLWAKLEKLTGNTGQLKGSE